jgi:hypothetical protein
MANCISDYAANKMLDHMLGTTSWTMPANVYLALFTTNPTSAGTGTEVSGGSYARKSISFDSAASRTTDNSGKITFAAATASWGTVTHWGTFDALTSGNLINFGQLTTSRTVASGDTVELAIGDLDISVTGDA